MTEAARLITAAQELVKRRYVRRSKIQCPYGDCDGWMSDVIGGNPDRRLSDPSVDTYVRRRQCARCKRLFETEEIFRRLVKVQDVA